MKREDVALVAQLLTAMKDSAAKLEKAVKNGDKDAIAVAKQQLLEVQSHLAKIV